MYVLLEKINNFPKINRHYVRYITKITFRAFHKLIYVYIIEVKKDL